VSEKRKDRDEADTQRRDKNAAHATRQLNGLKFQFFFFFFFFFFGGEFSSFSQIVFGRQRIHDFSFKIREKTILGPKKIRQKSPQLPTI
jgi:hypothetical protein